MNINVRDNIKLYINLLSDVLNTNNKLEKIDFKKWIPNCIECLQFALDNEQLLIDKPSLYADTLSTLSLLYNWIFEEESWAYIELSQKFKKIYNAKECGEAFKILLNKMNKYKNKTKPIEKLPINYIDNEGNLKSVYQILNELSQQFKISNDN